MLNKKAEVYEGLKKIAENVGDSYPDDFGNLPAIQYTEEENKVHSWADNSEYESYVRYRIDIWDDENTSPFACEVDIVMSRLGLKRIQCMDVEDKSPEKHKLMRYEGIINSRNDRVTHK